MTPQSFPFSKNRYFPRKRMRSSDFIREQAYVERKLAFLSQWDFGAGVALGLDVQEIPCWCPPALRWTDMGAG